MTTTPTLEELAARVAALEQQLAALLPPTPPRRPQLPGGARYEQLVGKGADLWESDEELDEFLAGIRERRQRPGG